MTEPFPWPTTNLCWDCLVAVGQPHGEDCDVARCMVTGLQRYGCEAGCAGLHDCGEDRFTGHWPGEEDCLRLGLVIKAVLSGVETTLPDLNRLYMECEWDPTSKRWEKADDAT